MNAPIVALDEQSFEREVIEHAGPTLVEFWASWCGPCTMLSPVLEEIANEYEGRIKICKVDVDQYADLAARYGVRGVPTLTLFVDGSVEATRVGALPKAQLSSFLDDNL
ncbi:thioredoxin [Phytohalomonas tamaricis]|uniref:thioredoxin n=1 Tax=Phytohalomonas tamaricis TaxID=2081032 RepID=UPI000D0BC7C9|nr:thioredoxin [Phytohalomonas tamaricis]